MKRIVYILLLALLLTACGKETAIDQAPTTAPTAATIAPTAPTAATNATIALTPFNTPTDVELMPGVTYGNQAFETFLNDSAWYNRALCCTFYDLTDLPMAYFAFNGLDVQDNSSFTNEERAFLHTNWCEKYGATPWVDAVKVSATDLNKALVVLNTSTKDIPLPGDWLYYDKTDSYYAPSKPDSIPGSVDIKVTKVIRSGENVSVFWETDEAYLNNATGEVSKDGAQMVTVLSQHSFNNGQNYFYVILSNAPGSYSPLRFEDMSTPKDYAAFIKQEWWLLRAMGCTFEKPEDINPEYFFYLGLSQEDEKIFDLSMTPEEEKYVDAAYRQKTGAEPWTGCYKLPVAAMNKALSVVNVTAADLTYPSDWVYYDKTDAYYFWVSDAYGLTGWTVTNVEHSDDIVKVYWESPSIWNTQEKMFYPKGTKMVMTMQEKSDGSYLILSNVPVE